MFLSKVDFESGSKVDLEKSATDSVGLMRDGPDSASLKYYKSSCLCIHQMAAHMLYSMVSTSVPVLESSVMSGPEKIRSRDPWSHIVS